MIYKALQFSFSSSKGMTDSVREAPDLTGLSYSDGSGGREKGVVGTGRYDTSPVEDKSDDAEGSSDESGDVVADALGLDEKVADGGRRVSRGLRESMICVAAWR